MFANGHRLARSIFALLAASLFAAFGGGGTGKASATLTAADGLSRVSAVDSRARTAPADEPAAAGLPPARSQAGGASL